MTQASDRVRGDANGAAGQAVAELHESVV